ncbi:MAG: hypothetical protein BGP16_05090 [Sphingobium sp. 66-54]|nr:MAG: hypothetical protein BGP16_05090 [Sphingobium sp. 66-54]
MRRIVGAMGIVTVLALAPGALAAPNGAPPTVLGDLAKPDWMEEAPVIVPPEEALRRVVACGVDAARVTMQDDKALHETVLAVADGMALTDAQLDCAAGVSLETSYRIMPGPALTARYDAAYARMEKARAAEHWGALGGD